MPRFKKMENEGNIYIITRKVPFSHEDIPSGEVSGDTVERVFQFAFAMTFGQEGQHRNHRTRGRRRRRNGEIFADTFQGKIAEFAIYNVLSDIVHITTPDMRVCDLGEWDSEDLKIGQEEKSVSVKSTKSIGNLLLLEEGDWDRDARYIPNEKSYDYTILTRMNPFCAEVMKRNRKLYSDYEDEDELRRIITSLEWTYDIPGYVTKDDLVYIINNNYLIPQDALLNGKTEMDASNYYVQAGDMRPIEELVETIRG